MNKSLDNRLKKLERSKKPPAEFWYKRDGDFVHTYFGNTYLKTYLWSQWVLI